MTGSSLGSASSPPTNRWRIPLSDILVDEELSGAVSGALHSGWWSMGPRVEELEQTFAEFCGASHAVAVANGTAALHLALLAVGCGPGDEVILPSLNFVAAANAVSHTGARPVFCDVTGPDDLNLAPDDVEAAISPATKALLVLHYGGFPCQMSAILELAERHALDVVEDAAHAPGASWQGRMCGTLGRIGCFSFFSNKNLPVGEGGMIVTDDDELARKVRLLRSHGMTSLTWDRQRGHAHAYDVVEYGFNYRLDELRAAIGLVQLERLPMQNAARMRIVDRYRNGLDGVAGLAMPFRVRDTHSSPSHHLAVMVLPERASRDGLRAALERGGIQTSVHYPPIHTLSRYAGSSTRPLPRTETIAPRLVTLPLYGHMRDHEVDAVIEAVRGELSSANG